MVSLLRNSDRDLSADLVAAVARLLHCDAARIVTEVEGQRATVARFPVGSNLERFSDRVIDRAKNASGTVLMHDAEWDEGDSKNSLTRNSVSSVLCAPLRDQETLLGYLYLDRIRPNAPFTEEERALGDRLLPLFSLLLAVARRRQEQLRTIALFQRQGLEESGGMIYKQAAMAEAVTLARRIAPVDAPVLILGETGTGKELMARFIHSASGRQAGPFMAINCGAIPENLIESELYGHEKGAFTGAVQRKIGLFESAENGTIFLDEIGDLPQQQQAHLLRTLQEKEIRRVGGTETLPVNVRVIAATNRDLSADVAAGRFRQDLFFRLNVLALAMPALRERGDDVVLLAHYFIKKYCQQFGLAHKELSAAARNMLLGYSWPGNVRELQNVVQKTVLLSKGERLESSDLALGESPISLTLKDARQQAERAAITQTLSKTQGNISLAAKILEIDRKWLMKLMDELGINIHQFRKGAPL
jgi:transcriptional regulator with GAF, ATPase, and Fis domain